MILLSSLGESYKRLGAVWLSMCGTSEFSTEPGESCRLTITKRYSYWGNCFILFNMHFGRQNKCFSLYQFKEERARSNFKKICCLLYLSCSRCNMAIFSPVIFSFMLVTPLKSETDFVTHLQSRNVHGAGSVCEARHRSRERVCVKMFRVFCPLRLLCSHVCLNL